MKAEEFIKDCTKTGSNELIAVESKYGKEIISYNEWLTPDQALRAVELGREEISASIRAKVLEYRDKRSESFVDGSFFDFDALLNFIDAECSQVLPVKEEKKEIPPRFPQSSVNWRTDKPTEDVIVAQLNADFCGGKERYAILYMGTQAHLGVVCQGYFEDGEEVPSSAIAKWASMKEEPVSEELEEVN